MDISTEVVMAHTYRLTGEKQMHDEVNGLAESSLGETCRKRRTFWGMGCRRNLALAGSGKFKHLPSRGLTEGAPGDLGTKLRIWAPDFEP